MKKLFVSMMVVAFLVSMSDVHAYDTTSQKEVRLTDEYVLFTISYDFGFLNRATLIPYIASGATSTKPIVTYAIEDAAGKQVNVASGGFVTQVVQNTSKDGFYYLPYGKKNEYTLNVIAQIPKGSAGHRLVVTGLPYILEDVDGTLTRGDAESGKLVEYKTKLVQ